MSTSRHPTYGLHPVAGDELVDSTEVARELRTSPSDPLAWTRYEQLRANGTLRPVTLEPVPLFDPDHVARVARPWEYPEDVYEPARGIEVALIASFAVAVAVVILVAVVR